MIARLRTALRSHAGRRADALGIAILAILTNLSFWPFLWGGATIQDSAVVSSLYTAGSRDPNPTAWPVDREVDMGAGAWQTEPWFALEHDLAFNEKTVPLWNPYSAFGTPLLANMQSQPFSPFAWVATLGDDALAYNWFVALRMFAGGALAFLFLRQFLTLGPALAGGASYLYCGYLWLYVTMPEGSVEAFIPGLLLGFELLLRKQTTARIAFLAAMLALAVFGGMPESILLAFAFAYAYGAWRLIGEAGFRSRALPITAAVASASALGLGLSAAQLLPFLEYVPLAHTDHMDLTFGLTHDDWMPSLPALYVAPLIQGPPVNNIFTDFSGFSGVRGFFGAAGTFFACCAIVLRVRDALERRTSQAPVAFFALFAAAAIAKRFGVPLVNWIGALPGFQVTEFPKYGEATLGCAAALLVGFGVAAVAERRVSSANAALAAVVPLTALTVAACVDARPLAKLTDNQWYFAYGSVCALAVLTIVILISLLARRWAGASRAVAAAALFALVAETHAAYIVPMFYRLDPEPPLSQSTLLGAPYVNVLRTRTRDASRMLGLDFLFYPEWSAAFKVPDVRAVDALYDSHYLKLAQTLYGAGGEDVIQDRLTGEEPLDFGSPSWQRFLELGSVRYILSRQPLSALGPLSRWMAAHPELENPKLRAGTFAIGKVARAGLFMHPPQHRVPIDFEVPPNASVLSFGIGMLPDVWSGPICGDGVRFKLEVRSDRGTRSLFERYIDPKHIVEQRRWIDQRVSIAGFRGQKVTLLLSTSPGPSGQTCADWAVWSDVRALSRPSEAAFAPSPYRVVYRDPLVTVSEFARALPRVAVFRHVVVARDDADALRRVASAGFQPQREAIVEPGVAGDPALAALGRTAAAPVIPGALEYYASRRVRARIDAPAPALVVLNDTDFPGWVATVDGRRVPILRANYLFRGVVVGAGSHIVEFVYQPRSYAIGRDASLVSFALVVALPFVRRRGRLGSRR